MTTHRSGPSLPSGLVLAVLALLPSGCKDADVSKATIASWPPEVDQAFPDMTVLDHEGRKVALSWFKGRVVLFEPIGMSCPGCVGFCGGAKYGAFEGVQPQRGLGSIDEHFERFAGGADIDDENLAVVHMLFFDLSLQTPTQADAAKWARHFRIGDRSNHYVVIGPGSLRDRTFDKVPGYWLVDKDFVLRCDATGHHPPSNLYTDLLPMVPELLSAEASAPR